MNGQWVLTSERKPPFAGQWVSDFWDDSFRDDVPPRVGINCHYRKWDGKQWYAKNTGGVLPEAINNEIYWWEELPAMKGLEHLIYRPTSTPFLEHAGSRSHYKDIIPGYEYMDIMEHVLGYEGTVAHLRGQIFKYLFRFGKKDTEGSESEKISWYSSRLDDVVKRNAEGKFPIER